MEREVHRLQKLITDKDNQIKFLTETNKELQTKLQQAKKQITSLQQKSMKTFSYQSIPDRQIITTLQSKIAASAWQVLQLQNSNSQQQKTILQLQQDLLTKQQELVLLKMATSETCGDETVSNSVEGEMDRVFQEWEKTIQDKQRLVEENLGLKQMLRNKEQEIVEKIGFYLDQLHRTSGQIKNQHQQQKQKTSQFDNLIKQLKKQNTQLRQSLKTKNQQILIFCQQSKLISTTKASDLHTIRNLRAELKRKGEQYMKILAKLQETEELKKILMRYNQECLQNIGEFNKIAQNLETTKRQNAVLKQKLTANQKKAEDNQLIKQQQTKKLYELLIENQACHQLLYETRGFSNLFSKDIEAKIERFLENLEKRRKYCESWMDVTELIAINEKLRNKGIKATD